MTELDSIGFIVRSKYRKQVFEKISKKLIQPSEIEKEVDLRFTHVTRELRNLKDKNLIECINPEDKKGRLYRLTSKGMKLKDEMKKEGLIDN